jgi:hypothetical protein
MAVDNAVAAYIPETRPLIRAGGNNQNAIAGTLAHDLP